MHIVLFQKEQRVSKTEEAVNAQHEQVDEHLSTGDGIAMAGVWLAYAFVLAALFLRTTPFVPWFFWAVLIVGGIIALAITEDIVR